MAKTKTKNNSKQRDILRSTSSLVRSPPKPLQKSVEDLLTEAAVYLQSQPDIALPLAEEALQRLEDERQQRDPAQKEDEIDIEELLTLSADGKPTLPPALVLNAEIFVALEDVDRARKAFIRATNIDKDGALISAEPWLWLAQLCEEGGRESIGYFEQACEVLRNEIEVLEEAVNELHYDPEAEAGTKKMLDERKSKLADALCAMAEVYMTDLSWEADAEARCETLLTEAVAACPEYLSAGVLQTLASVRISQERLEDARTALKRSLDIWHKESSSPAPEEAAEDEIGAADSAPGDDVRTPDFATRVSLTRLLMEVQLEQLALSVIHGLVREDDQSVECWYLGGWCQVLLAQQLAVTSEMKLKSQSTARTWLENCLRLYQLQDYDDERLRDHAIELVEGLKQELGTDREMDEDGDDGWEDTSEPDDAEDQDEDVDLEIDDEGVNDHLVAKTPDDDVEMT